VADNDPKLSELLREFLTAEGHEVVCVQSVGAAESELSHYPYHAMVCALELSGGGAVGLAHRTSGLPPLILASSRSPSDPKVKETEKTLEAQRYFRKPFAMFDLADTLRQLVPQGRVSPAGPTPRSRRSARALDSSVGASVEPSGVHELTDDAVGLLSIIWTERKTGVLQIVPASADHPGGRVSFDGGGPVASRAWAMLRSLLNRGGRVSFAESEVEGLGDWAGMGRVLFDSVREPGTKGFVDRHAHRILHTTARARALPGLPVALELRDLLESADGHRRLEELFDTSGCDPLEVEVDLHALWRLGVVSLRTPRGASLESRERGSRASRGEALRRRRRQRGGGDVGRTRRRRLGAAATSQYSSPRRADSVSSVSSVSDAGGGRAGPTVDKLRTILEQELKAVRTARPAAVLQIDEDASTGTVDMARRRMAPRYERWMLDDALPTDVRRLAREIHVIVDQAYSRMEKDARSREWARPEPTSPEAVTDVNGVGRDASEEERLLAMGREYIRQKAWGKADQVLSRARDIRLDHSDVLANLAWARYHNPGFGEEVRLEEARDLLLLVEQFDPRHAEGQYFLAQLLYRTGEFRAALDRARRASRAQPSEKGIRELIGRIERHIDD